MFIKKHSVIYLPFRFHSMNGVLSESKRVFSVTNIAGYVFGLLGLSLFAVTQLVTALIPLLFAPLVCTVFGVILYKSKSFETQSEIRVVPSPKTTQK